MPKKKLIENYQLLSLVSTIEQLSYETYQAFHVLEKTPYTIKRLKFKYDKLSISERFQHQASLLKTIKHNNIAKPIKMLKTSTSLYVVYEHYSGLSLRQYMQEEEQKKAKHTLTEKQSIIKQLASLLLELSKQGVAHLSFTPESIFINDNTDIKVTNFLFAVHLPDNEQQLQLQDQLMQSLPIAEFTAPQVKKAKALIFSDVYSFGKIVEFLNLSNSKKGTLSSKEFDKKVEYYNEIIKKTVKRKPYQRLSIEQVYQTYLIPKSKLKKLASLSLSMSMSKIMSGKQSMVSRSNSVSTMSMMGTKNAAFVQEVILTIIKRHNMSKLVIELIKNISLCEQHPRPQELIIVCAMLLKKSTLIINSLGKFMKYCKGIPQLQLNEKQRNRMLKSGDFIKLQPIIDGQVKQQRKLYQQALQGIYLDNVKLLQNKKFNQQLKRQQIDQNYLLQLLQNLITTSTSEIILEEEHSSYLKSVYLLMIIVESGGIDKFFEKKISLRPIEISQQPVFSQLYHEMTIPQMIQQLRGKWQKKTQSSHENGEVVVDGESRIDNGDSKQVIPAVAIS